MREFEHKPQIQQIPIVEKKKTVSETLIEKWYRLLIYNGPGMSPMTSPKRSLIEMLYVPVTSSACAVRSDDTWRQVGSDVFFAVNPWTKNRPYET